MLYENLVKMLVYVAIFIVMKGVITYNEELILFVVYLSLFLVFLVAVKESIKGFLINKMIKIMDKWDRIFFYKIIILWTLYKFLKVVKKVEYMEFDINLMNYVIKKKNNVYFNNREKYTKILLLSLVNIVELIKLEYKI